MTDKVPSLKTKASTATKTEVDHAQIVDNGQASSASLQNPTGVTGSDSTVQSPLAPSAILESEQSDHLNTAAAYEQTVPDVAVEILTLEQLDHQRTLRQALGQVVLEAEDEAEMREIAEKNVEALKARRKDHSADDKEQIESMPSTWSITAGSGKTIKAVNRITGATFEGPASDFLKRD